MAEVKNSRLLDQLIEYGKAFDGSTLDLITIERFVVAVMDTICNRSGIETDPSDLGALRDLMERLMPDHARGYDLTRDGFTLYIKECQTETDGFLFRRGLEKAKKLIGGEGYDCLTAPILLEYFILHPSRFFSAYTGIFTGRLRLRDEILSRRDPEKQEKKAEAPAKAESAPAPEDGFASMKESLSAITAAMKRYYDALTEEVLGQDHAVSEFVSGLFRSEMVSRTDPDRKRPRATFLFAGPPGVGKTYLAETAAALLGLPFKRFDMSEYCNKEASLEFIGSDSVYRDSKPGNFTVFIDKNPKSVILLDEIEKAHISIIHLFLQVLDAGQLRDSKTDLTLSLKDTILIFTTNAGKQLYQNSESGNFSDLSRKVILKALEKDVNPETKEPYFPPAICSRFAAGNVVMFNHLPPEVLRKIAVKQIQKNIDGFKEVFDIGIEVDEDVYTSLLFSEGGSVDGRMISARAETFFHGEVFELFRLMESEKSGSKIADLERIRFTAQIPGDDPDIRDLYISNTVSSLLIIAPGKIVRACGDNASMVEIISVKDVNEAKAVLKDREINCVLIDPTFGRAEKKQYLNTEDEISAARDFLRFMMKEQSGLPVYLVQDGESRLSAEEEVSYRNIGVNGMLTLTDEPDDFRAQLDVMLSELHQRSSVVRLTKMNRLIDFETAQELSQDGKTAGIKLFDFSMTVAVEAEDSENILSGLSKPDVTYDKVVGAEDAKSELKFFVEYLKNPRKYIGTGVGAPRGVLLYGPPGTGKTMLAKATANASDVTFLSAVGNQFVVGHPGESARKIRDIFRTARKYAPSIIFIDELDTIAHTRTGSGNTVGNEEALTALLAEMDGFRRDNSKPVFVLAATNCDVGSKGENGLDPAVLRRFDRRIYVDLPNRDERRQYLTDRFKEDPVFEISDEKTENIAVRSTGMSIAQLESVIELALRSAIKDGDLKVTEAIFDEAFETFNSGEEKEWDDALLERVARHEAGHAFLYRMCGETPSYITVVARGGHGGYMQHDDAENKPLHTRRELTDLILTSLGGRAAEVIYYGEEGLSTGASGDLSNATELARRMICAYGMSDRFGLAVIDPRTSAGGELSSEIYEEINRILSREMERAVAILSENRAAIDALVKELIGKNHLSGSEIETILENYVPAKQPDRKE